MASQSRYAGLTAIERLDVAGLKAEFDAAAQARARSDMVRILVQVECAEATWTVDMIIANPRRYGY